MPPKPGHHFYSRSVYSARKPSTKKNSSSSSESISYSKKSEEILGRNKSLNKAVDPSRWEIDEFTTLNKNPIVLAIDVTGSMGNWSKIIYDKLPMFYGQLKIQNYLPDPSISFCGIGDANSDDAPLQITEFGQGLQLDKLIAGIWLEGCGGGGFRETYELSAYFYAYQYKPSKYSTLPFYFVTGDELFYDKIKKRQVKSIMHKKIDQDVNSSVVWKDLKRKFKGNVFLLKKPYSHYSAEKEILKGWEKVLGKEHVLQFQTPKACIDIILGVIAIVSKSRSLETYKRDMEKRGQDKSRIAEVVRALGPLNHKLVNPSDIIEEKQPKEPKEPKEEKPERKTRKKRREKIPNEYLCPITHDLFTDPVITDDGQTYERSAIEMWLKSNISSPLTGKRLKSKILRPNILLKKLVVEFKEKNDIC